MLQSRSEKINDVIERFLPKEGKHDQLIVNAMNYSVQAGGKRLRPIMMQTAFHVFANDANEPEILHRFMTAIECIHTYSLCHDDLPAMDNDMYRRGNLTTHAKFGEAFGILAGDGLLNYAFELIAEGMQKEDPSDLPKAVYSFCVLAKKAGYRGMVGGQSLDVFLDQTQDVQTKQDQLEYIYRTKTSALLEASFMIGAILAGATDQEVSILEEAAAKTGFAFQIQDDILDLTGDEETIGKPIHSDEKNGKKTFVSFAGLEQAKTAVAEYSYEAIHLLDNIPYPTDELKELIAYLIDRDN